MTRSIRPRPQEIEPFDDDDGDLRAHRFKRLLGLMALCLAILFMGVIAVNWMMTDISGEYVAGGSGLNNLSVSLLREPASLTGQLIIKSTTLDLVTTEPPRDNKIDLVFATSPEWEKSGHRPRRIALRGVVEHGMIKGELQGEKTFPVTLERDAVASIYRRIQSWLP